MDQLTPLTVGDLKKLLDEYDDNIKIIYALHSEHTVMEAIEISPLKACKPRPDGWVQNFREDMESEDYLLFPGN